MISNSYYYAKTPQHEKAEGEFLQVPKSIQRWLMQAELTLLEHRVVQAILAETAGFHRPYTRECAASYIAKATNLDAAKVRRTIRSLINKDILRVIKKATSRIGAQYILVPLINCFKPLLHAVDKQSGIRVHAEAFLKSRGTQTAPLEGPNQPLQSEARGAELAPNKESPKINIKIKPNGTSEGFMENLFRTSDSRKLGDGKRYGAASKAASDFMAALRSRVVIDPA